MSAPQTTSVTSGADNTWIKEHLLTTHHRFLSTCSSNIANTTRILSHNPITKFIIDLTPFITELTSLFPTLSCIHSNINMLTDLYIHWLENTNAVAVYQDETLGMMPPDWIMTRNLAPPTKEQAGRRCEVWVTETGWFRLLGKEECHHLDIEKF